MLSIPVENLRHVSKVHSLVIMPWHFVDSSDMVLRTQLFLLILFGDWVAVIVTSGPDQGATLLAGGGRYVVENMGVNRALTYSNA